MTDIERIELAIRRVMASMKTTGTPEWFAMLADQLALMRNPEVDALISLRCDQGEHKDEYACGYSDWVLRR